MDLAPKVSACVNASFYHTRFGEFVIEATLAARNLFNEEYYWNADGETADPGRPRQILFTISVGLK